MKQGGLRDEMLDPLVEVLYKKINGAEVTDEELSVFSEEEQAVIFNISMTVSVSSDAGPLLLFMMEYYRNKTTTTFNVRIE